MKTKVTFTMPCLNEAETLKKLLPECKAAFANSPNLDWQILVADNGSTDGSVSLAQSLGADVAHVEQKGYGAAVDGGIMAATGKYVVYADADGTYVPADAVKLVEKAVETDAELVIGTRLKGHIEKGAMPWTHRYLGTPVLSFLIRHLYKIQITDCNSGIRCVRKSGYSRWRPRSPGMEFASAMLIKAANAGVKIVEVPAHLRKGDDDRIPHLRTWRDGMRHLLVVLAGAPWFFWRVGSVLLVLSILLAVGCFFEKPVLGGAWGFGPHTLAVTTIIGFYGALSIGISLSLFNRITAFSPFKPPPLANALVDLSEDVLFWSIVFFTSLFAFGVSWMFYQWSLSDFGGLSYIRWALFILYMTVVPVTLGVGILQSHLQKRSKI